MENIHNIIFITESFHRVFTGPVRAGDRGYDRRYRGKQDGAARDHARFRGRD